MTIDTRPARFDAVLIDGGNMQAVLEPLIASAGGRVVRRVSWDSLEVLAFLAPRIVIAADMRGGEIHADALDRLGHLVETHHCQLVALLDLVAIDACASLQRYGAQLLCDPDDVEIVAAMAIAGGLGVALHDVLGESEAARLQRINDEVARIAEALSRLTQRERPTHSTNDFHVAFDAGPSAVTIEAAEVRRTIRARRLRDRQFGQGLFEDPAWDMILDLFAAELEHGQVSVSSLCVAAAVAPTTALRWIGKLTDAGLFRRQPDPFDRRRAFIELSPGASAGMRSYVASVRAAGLPIA